MAFYGEYLHGIDEKGRLTLPAKIRDLLGGRYMICKGMEGCLSVYPMTAWTKLEEKLDELPDFTQDVREVKRRFFSGSSEGETDRQGRTMISQSLRSAAKLTKDVYIVGAGNHLEIWDRETWEAYSAKLDETYEKQAEEIFK